MKTLMKSGWELLIILLSLIELYFDYNYLKCLVEDCPRPGGFAGMNIALLTVILIALIVFKRKNRYHNIRYITAWIFAALAIIGMLQSFNDNVGVAVIMYAINVLFLISMSLWIIKLKSKYE